MPRALSPHETFEVWLEIDSQTPKAKRPIFICRHLTTREARILADLDSHLDTSSVESAVTGLYDAVWEHLAGWRNMVHPDTDEQIPFARDRIEEVLNPADARELLLCLIAGTSPTEVELGNSESPSFSSMGGSAKSAAEAALTSPASASLRSSPAPATDGTSDAPSAGGAANSS